MQPENSRAKLKWALLWGAVAVLLLFRLHVPFLKAAGQVLSQLFFGLMLSAIAFPLCRRLEKKLSPGVAALLSLLLLFLLLALLVLLVMPSLIAQGRQLVSTLPQLYAKFSAVGQGFRQWLAKKGLSLPGDYKAEALDALKALAEGGIMRAAGLIRGFFGGVSRFFLTPVFAFYLLRDRREISRFVLSLLPVEMRSFILNVLQQMRREIVGYLRAQVLLSLSVGLLTAAGLLVCGVSSWLILGVAMAFLELIPYLGPLAGGALVALFSWQQGLGRMLWAMGVFLAVQQLENSLLSPKLMAQATRLHPLAVLVMALFGGVMGGVAGILLALPLLICLRAVWQVVCRERLRRRIHAMGSPGAE